MKTICPCSFETIPWMRLRVVCGFDVTMATFWPTRRLSKVDLPAFGRPTMATKPARFADLVSAVIGFIRKRSDCAFLLREIFSLLAEVKFYARGVSKLLSGWRRGLRSGNLRDRFCRQERELCRWHD